MLGESKRRGATSRSIVLSSEMPDQIKFHLEGENKGTFAKEAHAVIRLMRLRRKKKLEEGHNVNEKNIKKMPYAALVPGTQKGRN